MNFDLIFKLQIKLVISMQIHFNTKQQIFKIAVATHISVTFLNDNCVKTETLMRHT